MLYVIQCFVGVQETSNFVKNDFAIYTGVMAVNLIGSSILLVLLLLLTCVLLLVIYFENHSVVNFAIISLAFE